MAAGETPGFAKGSPGWLWEPPWQLQECPPSGADCGEAFPGAAACAIAPGMGPGAPGGCIVGPGIIGDGGHGDGIGPGKTGPATPGWTMHGLPVGIPPKDGSCIY